MQRIYTMGHGILSEDEFFRRLADHRIDVLVDVRSTPFSQRNPHFNRDLLGALARQRGVDYVWEYWLGGKPKQASLWLAPDLPNYPEMARQPECLEALDRLEQRARVSQVALLCSEGDPNQCHRVRMLSKPLLDRGLLPTHIWPDGTLREEIAATGRLL